MERTLECAKVKSTMIVCFRQEPVHAVIPSSRVSGRPRSSAGA